MHYDKFGIISLTGGLVLLAGFLQFLFMGTGWTTANLLTAIVVTLEGGAILFALLLIVIGIMILTL